MTEVSLLAVSSYLPQTVVENDFFGHGAAERRGMFTAPRERRHIGPSETAVDMIERAALALAETLNLDRRNDIDLLFTNVALPDQAFTGCGAEVAHRLGCRPRFIIDLHNSGCVSFVYMLELARALLEEGSARGALLCCAQTAAGRVFSQPALRNESHAPVPGDGCGVGYVAASAVSPILSIVHRCQPEFASDMVAEAADGRRYWQPGPSPITLKFTEQRVASILHRGNAVVPELVGEACRAAGVSPRELDLLVTNQPNPIFLRNWREALELPAEKHQDTFDRYGNLFGAAIPINLEEALKQGKLRPGQLAALGGFAHAGDYAAAAILRWQANRSDRASAAPAISA
ncbi:MAG TPA: 3-oxoacyl-ACP synthase III family protein, partial [Polyangiaceae bacterium]